MRALLFGLVGILAGVAGAGAAEQCSPDRAVLKVVDSGLRYAGREIERPDLIGKTFAVRRYTDRRKMVINPGTGSPREVGYQGIQIAGMAGSFLVQQHHIIGSPSVWGESYSGGNSQPQLSWVSLSHKEKATVGDDLYYVNEGPLASLTLQVVACRNQHHITPK